MVLVMQHFRHKNFCGFANILLHISLKAESKPTRFWNSSLNLEVGVLNFFLLFFQKMHFCSFQRFATGHIHNVVLTLINVVKLDVENNNIVSTLSKLVSIKVEIDNVDSTLFNVESFNVDKYNFLSTLIWRCLTSQRHINLITTLKQRWNACWGILNYPMNYGTPKITIALQINMGHS